MIEQFFSLAAATTQSVAIETVWSIDALFALVTLTALEIVLGIDNIVFIAILAGKLPSNQQNKARQLGLTLAMGIRILLLLSISWIMGLTTPLFEIPFMRHRGALSGRDLILLIGGLFLIFKSTWEIHGKLEGEDHHRDAARSRSGFVGVIVQILLLDIVFSLDSVITAVGMVQTSRDNHWPGLIVMITAVVIAVLVMLVFARPVSAFVEKHPTIKMLALSFLLLIGVMLVGEAFEAHIPKGYIYFAMAFSLVVEMFNIKMRKKAPPVKLHEFEKMPEPMA